MEQILLERSIIGILDPADISVRCPSCGQIGMFYELGSELKDAKVQDPQGRPLALGQRMCPNTDCNSHLFTVWDRAKNELVATYPPEIIDFDSTSIPIRVHENFEQALLCHSVGANIAAAIMVRRTLEELCVDQGANGNDLKEKIESLTDKITVPKDLLDGADELRLLGNDAAHVEAQDFVDIGDAELRVAIKFTKVLLQATYQLGDLVAELRALKNVASEDVTD